MTTGWVSDLLVQPEQNGTQHKADICTEPEIDTDTRRKEFGAVIHAQHGSGAKNVGGDTAHLWCHAVEGHRAGERIRSANLGHATILVTVSIRLFKGFLGRETDNMTDCSATFVGTFNRRATGQQK